jgi:hypothetical protein
MSDDKPIKSAYELAMERLSKEQGEIAPLSDDQKERLAEVTKHFKAKRVERELALKPEIEAALIKGEFDEAEKLRAQLAADLTRLDGEEEEQKQAIRDEAAEGGAGG